MCHAYVQLLVPETGVQGGFVLVCIHSIVTTTFSNSIYVDTYNYILDEGFRLHIAKKITTIKQYFFMNVLFMKILMYYFGFY